MTRGIEQAASPAEPKAKGGRNRAAGGGPVLPRVDSGRAPRKSKPPYWVASFFGMTRGIEQAASPAEPKAKGGRNRAAGGGPVLPRVDSGRAPRKSKPPY
ncbi:hypothetical protein H8711_07820 [Clostridiaceae bacterium NSJ-31]|uniref:Uncharacterized protein n=2 Tax=Ligaoa zhengdingensis TaxID=2763658 RepID=A0A926E0J5_9FIRM|nr:hypothetical protein [Ligaoa zhengdingensis]MBC8546839.1 hypothetical protein [Ligaoa zhengdingensis]